MEGSRIGRHTEVSKEVAPAAMAAASGRSTYLVDELTVLRVYRPWQVIRRLRRDLDGEEGGGIEVITF